MSEFSTPKSAATIYVGPVGYPGGNKVAAIKLTRAILFLGLKEAKELVEAAVSERVPAELTEEQIAQFRHAGFTIEVAGDIDTRKTLREIAAQEVLAGRFNAASDIIRILKKHYEV